MATHDVQEVIANGFNQEPFKKGLTLAQFDELTPPELLSMLNEVFAHLSPEQDVDLRDEPPEQTAFRMGTFLRVLNFRPQVQVSSPEELGQYLTGGDMNMMYAVLHFLFSKLPDLRKRAYLARFLVDPGIPHDVLSSDDEVLQTYQQYREMQKEFTRTHKQVDILRGQIATPDELKEKISQVEREVDELDEKINRIRRGMDLDEPDSFIAACAELRRHEEDLAKFDKAIKEQQDRLKAESEKYRGSSSQVAEFKETALHGTPTQIIQALEAECAANRKVATQELPAEIKTKQARLEGVQKSLAGETFSNFAIEELTRTVDSMKREVRELEVKKQTPIANDRLAQFRPQAQATASRKKDQRERLRLLQDERDGLAATLAQKEEDFKALGDHQKVLTGAEFQQYAVSLREKHGLFQRKKHEEQEIKAELTILQRTEQILGNRGSNMKEILARMEAERGVSGYMETQNELEKVSEQKMAVDTQKGQTLEQMSAVEMEMRGKIKEQKLKLKEPIKELKYVLRPKYKELGEQYKEKKQIYEREKHAEEKQIAGIKQEVKDLEEANSRDETRWHHMNARAQITAVMDSRLGPIAAGTKEPLSGTVCNSYKDLYTARLKALQVENDKMRKVKKEKEASYEPLKNQMEMLANCQRLLACKRHCLRTQQDGGYGGGAMDDGMNEGGAPTFHQENMLVL